jgi:CRP/FNR family cyclic AMP-dependent transcriptional regulator
MVVETTFDLLAQHPFLAGLSPLQLDRLSYWAHSAVLRGGVRLFDEGGRADRFWLVLEGGIRLDTHLAEHGDVVVDHLGPGSVLGWSWMFPPYRWHFAATTTEMTHAVVVDGPGLREVCDGDPVLGLEIYRRFLNVVVDRLQHTRQRLLEAYTVD